MQGEVWQFNESKVHGRYRASFEVRPPWSSHDHLKLAKTSTVLFINHIARLLKIKRPEPFEIEIPKTDTFSNDGSADDERTNDLLYGHELGGIDKGALVSFKSEFSSLSVDR